MNELTINLDSRSKKPLYEQIYDYIKSKDVYNQKHNGDLYLICEVIYE